MLLITLKFFAFLVGLNLVLLLALNLLGKTKLSLLTLNLFLITSLLAVMGAEYFTRFLFRDVTTTSDNRSFFSSRWYEKNLRTNRFGFRERDYAIPKPANTIRVAAVGDSFTYGQGVLEEDRYTNILEKQLNAPSSKSLKFEVLNFAKPGTDTLEHVGFLKKYALPSNSDMAILQFYINDFENSDRGNRPSPKPFLYQFRFHKDLAVHSAFYYLINQFWTRFQSQHMQSEDYQAYMSEHFTSITSVDYQKWETQMRAFIETCHQAHLPLMVVLFPSLDAIASNSYAFQFLHDHVYRVCDEYHVPYYDLLADFQKAPDPKRAYRLNRFDAHTNVPANKLAAEKIHQKLVEKFPYLFDRISQDDTNVVARKLDSIQASYPYLNQSRTR